MAAFYYDRFSGENVNSQWIKYLQTMAYLRDIDGIVTHNSQELQAKIQSASPEFKNAIQQVCGKLDKGFDEVTQHLKEINFNILGLQSEINEMASMLDWKLSMLIGEQQLTNQLLGQVAELLRIPDSQKQRVYFIEQGLKYLKNALLQGVKSDFFVDALESFSEAEKIEKKDYILLNRIGVIYLYSEKHLNIPLAEEYFHKSARESIAETNVNGTSISNTLSPHGYESTVYSRNPLLAATAESYIYASRCCYLRQNFSEAATLAKRAFDLVPEFVEAAFEHAKYLAANDQETEAAKTLERVIIKDRFFSVKALSDQDLSSKSSVLKLLGSFQQNAKKQAILELNKCKGLLRPGSNAKHVLKEIEELIETNSFLGAMRAIDLLDRSHKLSYMENTFTEIGRAIERKTITKPFKIIDFLKIENTSSNQLQSMIEAAEKRITTDNRKKGVKISGIIGFIAGWCVAYVTSDTINFWIVLFASMFLGALFGGYARNEATVIEK